MTMKFSPKKKLRQDITRWLTQRIKHGLSIDLAYPKVRRVLADYLVGLGWGMGELNKC